jgi:hypothetical protein
MAGESFQVYNTQARYNNMSEFNDSTNTDLETYSQPFLYEIRVRGRLSQEKWLSWFDNLTITAEKSETVLRGSVQDHAALYGLLGRLRDLAVPLLSVNVLDAEAQRKLRAKSKQYKLLNNLLLIGVYLFMMGGLIALNVFFATEIMPQSLSLAMLFAALGALGYIFFLWSGEKFWLIGSYLLSAAAVLTFLISLAVTGLVNPILTNSMIFFLAAGGLIYVLYYFSNRAEKLDAQLGEWETLSQEQDSDEDIELNDSIKLNQK